MLLAAGLGTRLRPYTEIRPKPLFPVLNKPLLNMLVEMLQDSGAARIVVNGHHLAGMIEQAVQPYPSVIFQDEPEVLGTGGGLRLALEQFSVDPILVMNGDIFHTVDVSRLYTYHLNSGNRITLALHDYTRFNTVTVDGKRVVSFRSVDKTPPDRLLAFTGIHVVEPDVLQLIPGGNFHHIIDLYEELAAKGEKVGYLRVDGDFWRDIGTPEDYLQLHGELLMPDGIKYPRIPDQSGPWLIGPGAKVAKDVNFSGWGCIGADAEIGSGVSLKNCVIWDHARVQDGDDFENRIITGHPDRR